jgi:HAD superfamily phosphatase (TIGR01681 family)
VAILDVDQIAARFGKDRWSDPVLWHTAKQYPSAEAMPALGHQLTALLRAILGLTAKCLALDLDGVLWGGVIGEDGLAGIQLGGGPAGEAFVDFQRYLQSLTRTGALLAVCSKNNPEDAVLPFRQHPEMVLRERDIAVFIANWKPKEENLRAIAAAMNIGLDAMVFVDDNPAERSRVRQNLPEVEVVDMPADPAQYVAAVSRLGCLKRSPSPGRTGSAPHRFGKTWSARRSNPVPAAWTITWRSSTSRFSWRLSMKSICRASCN